VGTVRLAEDGRAAFETSEKLPTDGRLKGQLVLFGNPEYSRDTAYRIASVEALPDGSRVVLESPSFVLGTGILEDDPENDRAFVSLLPHEYARSDSATGTQFFSGKRIKGEGFETNIVRTGFGQLMRYEVESTKGMGAGNEFVILDVQPGDSFRIPTTAYLRNDKETFTGAATTEVTVRRNGQVVVRIKP